MARRLRRIRRIIFCIKMYLIQFQSKTGRNGGQKGAILGKNDRLGGISSSVGLYLIRQMLYLVSKMLYLAKSGNRWYAYVSAIWVVYVVSPGEDGFSKRRILRFFADTITICISLYQSCLHVYNIHNGFIFSYYSSPPDI